jgi:L-lysine 2,3-aminomutase
MQETWQALLQAAIRSPEELLATLALDADLLPQAKRAAKLFPLRVPRGFVARMQQGDVHDPLLRQVLPLGLEEIADPHFSTDPLQERLANPLAGLLHKYYGRVLITLTGACAVHCRYCFRRHFPYQENIPSGNKWQAILEYIAKDKTIYEVIFSGGDPLLVNDRHLASCMRDLVRIPHVKILRIHSRLPIVLPERITLDFVNMLAATALQVVMVVHCNHANELDASVAQAMALLRQHGITVFNQSVLLQGVNDSVAALVNLSHGLFKCGILPYYLHLLDKVQGAAHFAVAEQQAKILMRALRAQLSGYLLPKFVREEYGGPSKLPIVDA